MANDSMKPGDPVTLKTSAGSEFPGMVVAAHSEGDATLIDVVYVIETDDGNLSATQSRVPIGPNMQDIGDEENPKMVPRNGSWVEPRA